MLRTFYITVLLVLAASLATAQTFYGTTDLKKFRQGRDHEFRDRAQSPLTDAGFAAFRGLSHFPNDPKYRVRARFTRTGDENYFLMPTSSGSAKKFVKYGVLDFSLAGRPLRLNVYQIDGAVRAASPEYADLLFIPFRDETSGKETYSGGRYIDIKIPKGISVILDFNLAYNPNCAYGSTKYSCPIPPRENRLNISIRAGERSYVLDEAQDPQTANKE